MMLHWIGKRLESHILRLILFRNVKALSSYIGSLASS
jgi:hypothetical protein